MANENKKTFFKLAQKPKFPKTNDSALMTSYDLSKHVNALMSRIFTDYAGCRVYVDQSQTANGYQMMDPNHPVHVDLYFALGKQKNPTDKTVYAFRQISDQVKEAAGTGKSNYVAACIGHNVAVTQNKSSEITQEAMDILGSMLWYNVAMGLSAKPSVKEFNNKGIVVEASTTQGNTPYMTPNTQKIVYNIVRYVDINSILNTLFTDEEEEEQLIYQVTPIKPIIPMPTGYVVPNTAEQKWLFNVNRLNQRTFSDLCNELGGFNTTNGINICTDSY